VRKDLNESTRNDDHEDTNEEDSGADKQEQDEYPNNPRKSRGPLKQTFD
jgi:hypothetical protein